MASQDRPGTKIREFQNIFCINMVHIIILHLKIKLDDIFSATYRHRAMLTSGTSSLVSIALEPYMAVNQKNNVIFVI